MIFHPHQFTSKNLVEEGMLVYLCLSSIPVNGVLMHMYGVEREPLDRGSYHLAMVIAAALKVAETIYRLDRIAGKLH